MIIVFFASEIPGSRRIAAGDDVEPGSSATDMVERSKKSRDIIGLVVAGGCRRNKTDVGRDCRHGRQQCDGLEVCGVLSRPRQDFERRVPDTRRIREEAEVQEGCFGSLRQIEVMVEIDCRIRLRIRMPP